MQQPDRPLQGAICVVTGASRGIGRGIAVELGKAGATVYITGTSTSAKRPSSSSSASSKYVSNQQVGGPETIEQTAQLVEAQGGHAIPVYCDHSDDSQVQALFHRIQETHGRLDILVNNAFRLPSGGSPTLVSEFGSESGIPMWDAVHTIGLRSHYVASCYAIPLMMRDARKTSHGDPNPSNNIPCPLIFMISSFGGTCYTFNVAYGVGKAGVDRLAKDMALVLKDKGIVVQSIYPGVVMTERMALAAQDPDWAKQVQYLVYIYRYVPCPLNT
jgi:dehydrogenase/reductase SDR family protein 1